MNRARNAELREIQQAKRAERAERQLKRQKLDGSGSKSLANKSVSFEQGVTSPSH